jgi:phage terminase large subunit-like protein
VLPRLKQAHQTMQNNLPKRKIADPWMLETTTAPEPGMGSVAEATMDYAKAVDEGRVTDSTLFFFHRQAGDEHDLNTVEGVRAAVIEASGPAAAWRDIDAIAGLWADPTTDKTFLERVWCNRLVKSASQAFNVVRWKELAQPTNPAKPGDTIVLGFDGAMFHDATGLIATHVETGYQWVLGLWECPHGRDDWQVPSEEVDAVVRDAFERFSVWRLYADPPYWQSWIAAWSGAFGEERVIEWQTNRRRAMTGALEGFSTAIREGAIKHSGDPRMQRHLANTRRQDLPGWVDENGRPLWLIRKERPDSPQKIDLTVAAVLSWKARTDAIAEGVGGESVYETRGVEFV